MTKLLKASDYDVSKLEFEAPIGANKKKSLQYIKFPVYDGEKSPCIQLPPIELDMYGIPSKCDYYKEEYQRMFIKLPLNQGLPETQNLKKFFKAIDKRGVEDYKGCLTVPNPSKYIYQPIVREPQNEDGTPNTERHPYIKLKLLLRYPSNEIETSVVEQKDGQRMYREAPTLEAFEKFFQIRSKITCIIAPVKLWMHPPTAVDCMYGVAFKLIKVLVELPVSRLVGESKNNPDFDFLEDEAEYEKPK